MAKGYRRQNQDRFGARRKLRQLQRKQRADEAKLGITAPVVVRDGKERKGEDGDDDLMGEEVFEAEMERGFKRED